MSVKIVLDFKSKKVYAPFLRGGEMRYSRLGMLAKAIQRTIDRYIYTSNLNYEIQRERRRTVFKGGLLLRYPDVIAVFNFRRHVNTFIIHEQSLARQVEHLVIKYLKG